MAIPRAGELREIRLSPGNRGATYTACFAIVGAGSSAARAGAPAGLAGPPEPRNAWAAPRCCPAARNRPPDDAGEFTTFLPDSLAKSDGCNYVVAPDDCRPCE